MPETLAEWAARQGLSTKLARPSVRAGEPCPCCTERELYGTIGKRLTYKALTAKEAN